MNFPIGEFEQHIEEKILQRGLSYFRNNCVEELEETSPGEFTAIVVGTEPYDVTVSLKKGMIEAYECTCPYDFGPVCKHVVAVLFLLQQDAIGIEPRKLKESAAGRTRAPRAAKKEKTEAERAQEVLQQVSHKQLLDFLSGHVHANDQLQSALLLRFGRSREQESRDYYAQRINDILNKAAGRGGYLDWSGLEKVGNEVSALIELARQEFDQENFESVFYIVAAILDELPDVLSMTGEEGEDISNAIEEAEELLQNLTERELPEPIRLALYDYLLVSYKSDKDREWNISTINLASGLAKSDDEIQQIFDGLDRRKHLDYEVAHAMRLKYSLLLRFKGADQADLFLYKNLQISEFRKLAIQSAMESKNFTSAIKLAEDGLKACKDKDYGLTRVWKRWLLDIAEAQGDEKAIIEHAEWLLVQDRSEVEFYIKTLKNNIKSSQWEPFLQNFFRKLADQGLYRNNSLVPKLFIYQEWWDKLLRYIQDDPGLSDLDSYTQYLAKDYGKELVRLYEPLVVKAAGRSTNRSDYQEVCRYLRKMNKLGGTETVQRMMQNFRQEYARRPAFIQELGRV